MPKTTKPANGGKRKPARKSAKKAAKKIAKPQPRMARAIAAHDRVTDAATEFAKAVVEHQEWQTKKRYRFRDAITGLFLRARDALKRRATSIRESVKR